MKAQLDSLDIKTKEGYSRKKRKVGIFLTVWDDCYLTEDYMDDTLGLGIKDCYLHNNGEENEDEDYVDFKAIWLTKAECIILKNHLDSFIQLAETHKELKEKENGTNN